jgi:hypothetical protein
MRDSAVGELVAADGVGPGVVVAVEHVFTVAAMRSQQVSNRVMRDELIHAWISSLLVEGSAHVAPLVVAIRSLWNEVAAIQRSRGGLIRRRDKRCVVAAVIASLDGGLSALSGEVVAAHGKGYAIMRFNKRTMWVNNHIAISDIRTGQRFLKKVFADVRCINIVYVVVVVVEPHTHTHTHTHTPDKKK